MRKMRVRKRKMEKKEKELRDKKRQKTARMNPQHAVAVVVL